MGGGVAATAPQMAQAGADTRGSASPDHPANTTIPGPSSIEEEGSMKMFALGAWRDAPVIAADDLTSADGPVLVVRADTQIAVLPGWRAAAEPGGARSR